MGCGHRQLGHRGVTQHVQHHFGGQHRGITGPDPIILGPGPVGEQGHARCATQHRPDEGPGHHGPALQQAHLAQQGRARAQPGHQPTSRMHLRQTPCGRCGLLNQLIKVRPALRVPAGHHHHGGQPPPWHRMRQGPGDPIPFGAPPTPSHRVGDARRAHGRHQIDTAQYIHHRHRSTRQHLRPPKNVNTQQGGDRFGRQRHGEKTL